MRGDVTLHLRILARPLGLIGVTGAVAGGVAFVAAYLPWYDVAATVDLLGASSQRAVASLPAWQAHPWGWLVPTLGVVAVIAGVGLAVDRPLVPGLLVWAGLGLAATVALGGLLFPPVERFDVAGSRLRELAALADRLPRDIEMSFAVRPAVGLWLALGATAVVVVTGIAARRLG